jgi:hypothetical protein
MMAPLMEVTANLSGKVSFFFSADLGIVVLRLMVLFFSGLIALARVQDLLILAVVSGLDDCSRFVLSGSPQ